MKIYLQFFIALSFVLESLHASVLLIDDFNDATKPNFVGGDFGSWNKNQNDETQSCTDSFVKNVFQGKAGCSLKLDYDVDSPNIAYNGFWMSLNRIDLSDYNTLVFYIKGDAKETFTKQIKIELKAKNGKIGHYILKNITKEWQKIAISFSKFSELNDWSEVLEFILVFQDALCDEKDGAIYIDNISFQKIA